MPSKRAANKLSAIAKNKSTDLLDNFRESVGDSYTNGPARIGVGTGNQAGQGVYPLTRVSQRYMEILGMYRSHWIVRKVIDVLAEDMLKNPPVLNCDLKPAQIKRFDKVLRDTGTIDKLLTALKWGRLFGGGVAVICIDGHDDLSKPLKLDDIDLNSYRGLIPLDRWSGVFPGASLITDMNYPRDFGLPETYTCSMQSAVVNVHHTRLIRFSGRPLPEWERQVEMYWGLSEVEVIYDELQKRDYTSWNIVSLVTRAQVMWIKDDQLAQGMSGASKTNAAFNTYLARMSALAESMNNQGLGVVGKDGDIKSNSYSFGGLSDIYNAFMADIAGACEIPMSRLYGRTTSGLGSNDEGDLQIYYDLVETKRHREVDPAMDKLLPIIAMSVYGKVPDDFDYSWKPTRTVTSKEQGELDKQRAESIQGLYEADLLTKREARMELAQNADEDGGLGSNITDEAVAATPDKYASEMGGGELDFPVDKESTNESTAETEDRPPQSKDEEKPAAKKKAATDSVALPGGSVEAMDLYHGMPVTIETKQGALRYGLFWKTRMPSDYGYINDVPGADGDDLDCYIGAYPESDRVFVVDQNQFDGKTFDEHKVMLGYHTMESALEDYMAGHHKSKQVYRGITEFSMPMFRKWVRSTDITKPCNREI